MGKAKLSHHCTSTFIRMLQQLTLTRLVNQQALPCELGSLLSWLEWMVIMRTH